jgi:L-lactate dehydrogenase
VPALGASGDPIPVGRLQQLVADLLIAAGLDADKAGTVARLLVLTDMLGRPTHGVALCPLYGRSARTGADGPHRRRPPS